HEVGAVDAIVDIVGAALCFEYLGVDRVASSSVELGGGFVHCAHGTLPVPAPATVEILKGVPVRTGGAPHEMTTPTGAAVLVSLADTFSDSMSFRLLGVGYGIGTRDTEIPNVLRVMLGEDSEDHSATGRESGEVWLVECNIDDMNPELYEHVLDRLFEKGARDAFMTPIIMKKSRPAVVLSVLCDTDRLDGVEEIVLTETTTLGLRKQRLSRTTLRRDADSVMTDYGEVRIKRTFRGNALVTWKPEYEDCRNIAREKEVSIQDVYIAVERAFEQRDDGTEQSK
ncbi:MAG TPA: nickel pincer cofactor biosynthesis protein LarC, partial [Deltaproteobacteria bacterium]|nr:nickel pincer cofactor biosynthesis protein LarC [Deltaproteobacteria bacterium]